MASRHSALVLPLVAALAASLLSTGGHLALAQQQDPSSGGAFLTFCTPDRAYSPWGVPPNAAWCGLGSSWPAAGSLPSASDLAGARFILPLDGWSWGLSANIRPPASSKMNVTYTGTLPPQVRACGQPTLATREC